MAHHKGSPRRSLGGTDWQKIGKSFLLGLTGVALGYTEQFARTGEFGDLTPLIAGLVPVLVNLARKYLFDTREL